ncbi:MAG: response regulator [Endomicrobiales bacterium]
MKIRKVLLFEDDPVISRLAGEFLRKKGFETVVTDRAGEIIALCRAEKPDLIAVDILMPENNGIAFLESLRNEPDLSSVPLILLSLTSGKAVSSHQAFHLGVVDWIKRPLDLEEFARIEKNIDNLLPQVLKSENKIAIIESDGAVAESTSIILKTQGYDTAVCDTGPSLPGRIAREKPILILLDIALIETVRALKSDAATSYIPVVVMCDTDVHELKKRSLLSRATEYFTSSFAPEVFLNEIENAIANYETTETRKYARILLGSGDAGLGRLTVNNLRLEGYEAILAPDGEEAMRLIYQEMPDIIILDVTLPGKDGIQVFREIRSDILLSNIPVILLEEKEKSGEKARGLELLSAEYLSKPYDLDDLTERVKALLKKTAHGREINPLTRLPGNGMVEDTVLGLIRSGQPFGVLYLDINYFKSYNDYYGFTRGDEVIRATARIILETLRELGFQDDFSGHGGSDDFTVITLPERVERLCNALIARFDRAVPSFYNCEDRECGFIITLDRRYNELKYPLISIAIGAATTQFRKLTSLGEVSKIGAEVKAFAKKFREQGSSYKIDVRKN